MRNSTRLVVFRKLWTPANIFPFLWLDAADFSTITLNSSTVSEWRDKSGNDLHATQATAANQPTYIANGLNGHPALSFDGVDDFFVSGTTASFNFLHNGQKSNVFVVFRPGRNTGTSNVIVSTSARSNLIGATASFINTFGAIVTRGVASSFVVSLVTSLSIVVDRWDIVRFGFDADASANNRAIVNLNGGADATGNTQSNPPSLSNSSHPLYIGNDPELLFPMLGAISEIIIINRGISTTDRQRIEGYLAHKWGLAANLPDSHPFRFTHPVV